MRTSPPLAATGALTAVLLLAACGPQPPASDGAERGAGEECRTGGSASPGPARGSGEVERDGVRITGRAVPVSEGSEAEPSLSPAPSGPARAVPPGGGDPDRPSDPSFLVRAETLPGFEPSGKTPERDRASADASDEDSAASDGALERDSARAAGAGAARCAVEYTVTNGGTEAFTYTITFDFLSDRGQVMDGATETVAAVGPGQTVRRTVGAGMAAAVGLPRRDFGAAQVRIADVKRVPADEAPAPAGSCPPSGLRLTADEGDAAMGLRVVGLRLVNCGSRPYSLDGYPALELLDDDLRPVPGVEVLRGGGGIAQVTGFDDPPRPVTLEPGEAASAGLMWRNTTESGTPVNVPYVRVRVRPGADPVIVTPELDLGTTGKLGVRAWRETG